MTVRLPELSMAEAQEAALKVDIPELKAGIGLYRVLLQQPILAKRINDLMETLSTESQFDARLRELVVMRIGWLNHGVYEFSLHYVIAAQLGVEEHELLAIRDWETHDHWSPADRAAFRAADEIVTNGTMSEATWNAYADHFQTAQERLDLTTMILAWKMMSDLIKNLEVPFETAFTPWPPNGVGPNQS